jgi:hypothetical protein
MPLYWDSSLFHMSRDKVNGYGKQEQRIKCNRPSICVTAQGVYTFLVLALKRRAGTEEKLSTTAHWMQNPERS